MMNSRKSPQQQGPNESKNLSTILPPEITSTPFVPNKTKTISPLVTPTRKFLGPRRYALSNNGMLNPMNAIRDPPGPLLASTSYNVNVSTYIDTKSPGYAGRLVQYNEENSTKKLNTHQEKYGSPGLLPIVHLFKKEVPVISPKLKKGTVRIGTPESRSYYSQEHSRLLLEGIVHNNSILKEQNNSNEASTRSVLDALKEISRKRIHAGEDYDCIDDNKKKFRKTNGDGDYTKRSRVESPPLDNTNSPPTIQAKKRLCTIDAVLASKTSSMYANYEMVNKRKSTEDFNNKLYSTNKKKFNNVETQTPGTPVIVREMKKTRINSESDQFKKEDNAENDAVVTEVSAPPNSVLKVLDDKPLEVIRKNRLGALLSALSGREIPSLPMEDRRKALDQEWASPNSEKTLVSILSPPKKPTKSVDKHVTFDLTPSTEIASDHSKDVDSNSTVSSNKGEERNSTINVQNDKSTLLEKSSGNTGIENSSANINIPPSTEIPQAKKEEKEKIVGGFKFDLNKPIDFKMNKTVVPSTQGNSNEVPKTETEILKNTSTSAPVFASSFEFKSPKPGGISSISSPQDISSGKSPTINSLGLPTSLPPVNSLKTPIVSSPATSFNFGNTTISEATSVPNSSSFKGTPSLNIGKNDNFSSISNSIVSPSTKNVEGFNSSSIVSENVSTSTLTFKGSGNFSTSSNNLLTSSSLTSSVSNVSALPKSSVPITSNIPMSSAFSSKSLNEVANSPSTNTFPTSSSSSGGFKFNGSPSFGIATTSVSTLPPVSTNTLVSSGNTIGSSTTSLLNTANKTNNPFGASSTSTIFGSNSAQNDAASPKSKPFAFGSVGDKTSNMTSPESSSTFTFSTSQTAITSSNSSANPQFAPSTNATNVFNTGKGTLFAPSTTSSFGTGGSFNFNAPNVSTTTVASSSGNSMFSPSTTTPFGTTKSFAFSNTNTSASPNFGTQNLPSFGATTASSFGGTTTSSFGGTTTPSFGGTATSSFGGTATSSFATTANAAFGTSNTPTFANANTPTFGTLNLTTTKNSSFGTSNTSTFGGNSIPNFGTNSTGTFGTTNTPSFSTSNTSLISKSIPSFGTVSSSSFSTNNQSSFSTVKAPMFGNNAPSTFGATGIGGLTGANGTFGVISTASAGFGTNTPTFGTPTSAFGATNTMSFGNVTTAPSFGSSFSSPSTLNAPSFGNASSPFGNTVASNTNAFNANNTTSTFGNPGSSSTFGSFNSNNTQSTSVTSASTFGTNNTFGSPAATNAFATNSTNVFGSPTATNPFGSNISSTSSNAFNASFGKKPEQPGFPASTNNMFNSNPSFGSGQSNNAGTSSSGVFTFGSSNNSGAAPSGVFNFGSTEPPKTFNFGASGSSGNVSTSASGGFNSASPFGQPNPAVPNMFTIGSGSANTSSASQARSRSVVRARRRT